MSDGAWLERRFRFFLLLMSELRGSYHKIAVNSSPITRNRPCIGFGRSVANNVAPLVQPSSKI